MAALAGLSYVVSPVHRGVISDGPSPEEHHAWLIGYILFAYANDNGGRYPDGNSSTEVFQKLIDANYVTDPSTFYLPLPGKTRPVPGQKLKPENVSWDITGGVTMKDSDGLPIVFMTGWKIAYVPDGGAVPLSKPVPLRGSFYSEPRSWAAWWRGEKIQRTPLDVIAVVYKNNVADVRTFEYRDSYGSYRYSEGAILNVVPKSFDPKGKTYRQLTPEGPLPN
jgi:hypothetical protein